MEHRTDVLIVSRRFRYFWLGFLALSLFGLGCADNTVKKVAVVNDTVSYKGQRLQSGLLCLTTIPGGAITSAPIKNDGTFTVTDVVPGEVTVSFIEGPPTSQGESGPARAEAKPAAKTKAGPPPIPVKYLKADTSDLKYTVTHDTKDLNIEVK